MLPLAYQPVNISSRQLASRKPLKRTPTPSLVWHAHTGLHLPTERATTPTPSLAMLCLPPRDGPQMKLELDRAAGQIGWVCTEARLHVLASVCVRRACHARIHAKGHRGWLACAGRHPLDALWDRAWASCWCWRGVMVGGRMIEAGTVAWHLCRTLKLESKGVCSRTLRSRHACLHGHALIHTRAYTRSPAQHA